MWHVSFTSFTYVCLRFDVVVQHTLWQQILPPPPSFQYEYYSFFSVFLFFCSLHPLVAVFFFEILVTIWNAEKCSRAFRGNNERVITAPSATNMVDESYYTTYIILRRESGARIYTAGEEDRLCIRKNTSYNILLRF